MKLELRRVDPLRAANIGAIVYGVLMAVLALIFSPFFLLGLFFSTASDAGLAGSIMGLFFLILYPVIGVVMGWISGLITSVIYNFVFRWTGGLLMEFDGGYADVGPAGQTVGPA